MNNIVYNKNCLIHEWKRSDLLIADPPYGIDGNSHRKNKSRGKLTMSKDYHTALWDQPKPNNAYFKMAFEISDNQIIFGGNYFPQLCEPHKTPRRNELEQWLQSHSTGWIVWDKVNGDTSYNDYELAWTSFQVPTKIYKFMWNGMMQGSGVYTGEIMQGHKILNEIRIHPTQKPVYLYKWIFLNYLKGKKVSDTHVGSGSSRIAAYDMGIDYEGTEIDSIHFKDQEKRFKIHTAQHQLFNIEEFTPN